MNPPIAAIVVAILAAAFFVTISLWHTETKPEVTVMGMMLAVLWLWLAGVFVRDRLKSRVKNSQK